VSTTAKAETQRDAAGEDTDAERFLQALDPDAFSFTFQTFDDNKKRREQSKKRNRPDPHAHVRHGALSKHADELQWLNADRVGIYVTVNETDGRGRKEENVTRVRAVFIDLDTPGPLPVFHVKPHIIVESSPQKWHAYWLTDEITLEEFSDVQKRLFEFYHSDPSVHDLSRVMRLPGFLHGKEATPFRSRLLEAHDLPPYARDELLAGLPEPETNGGGNDDFTPRDQTEHGALNTWALANLDAWVPKIFTAAKRDKNGCYRVSSADLGRNLQEDLSFTPQGIKDFGVADMGDEREGKRTPIDIVMIYKHLDFDAAVFWLQQALPPMPPPPLGNILRPYVARPYEEIPRREWLHAGHYQRKQVVGTIAPGDYGKTSLGLLNGIEMATYIGLIGPAPSAGKPLRVLYWNGEDPDEEIERRIAAICLRWGVDRATKLEGQLFVGGKLPTGQRFAKINRQHAVVVNQPLIAEVSKYIADNKIDVVIFDPLINFHSVPESDNMLMEQVVSDVFKTVAVDNNCCIEILHHTRKNTLTSAAGELTVDDSRGAGAIANAFRSVRVLNRMSKDEAASIPDITGEARRLYLRIDYGKTNTRRPPEKATWLHLVSVKLPNGDDVQTVEPWEFPKASAGVGIDVMQWIQDTVRADPKYRADSRADDWIGHLLGERINLDSESKAGKQHLSKIIRKLFRTKVLEPDWRKDETRQPRKYVKPGSWAPPGPERVRQPFTD